MDVIPLGIRLYVCLFLVAGGITLIWMARGTASGRVRRNRFAGIRIPSTMASEAAWRAAHVRTRRTTTIGGVALMLSGCAVLPPMSAWVLAAAVCAGSGVMVGCMVHGTRVGSRAAREANELPHRSDE